MVRSTKSAKQVLRFGVVGVLTNFAGWLIYVAVTWAWLEPKIAITVLYPIGAFLNYLGHARYSFAYRGSKVSGLARYIAAQGFAYALNITILVIFSDRLGFPHQLVQAGAIVAVAGTLFVLYRFFVFPESMLSEKETSWKMN